MARHPLLAVPILTLAMTSTGLAQPSLAPTIAPAQPVQSDEEVVVTSYRDQILIVSAIGVGSLLGAAVAEGENGRDTAASEALWGVGLAGTFLAPPIVHFANREAGRGLGSLGMRWGLAAIGGFVAMEIDNCDPTNDWFCDLEAFAPGALVGVTVASLIDAFALTEQRHPRRTERVLAPVVQASSQGGQVGLAGTF